MKSLTTLKTEVKEKGVLHITLARPDKLNALNSTMLEELGSVFLEAKNNMAIKGLLITGAGKAFCAGADITRLVSMDAQEGLTFAQQGQQIFRLLETLGKPSVAALNGYTFGGGCELALAATIRIASDKAQFGQPEVKLGVIPCYGGTQRLARLIGKGRALDLCTTGRFINASTAYDWGLVTGVTTPEDLLPQAEACLSGLLEQGPLAVAAVMQTIDQGFDLPLEDALKLEALQFAMTCATADKKEGTEAFLAKRPAVFCGR